MSNATLWLTGATGFVGSHFLHHVLEHTDTDVVAVLRTADTRAGFARLRDVLEQTAWSYRQVLDEERLAKRVRVVIGDITQPCCGVDPERLAALTRGDERRVFWHAAASLRYEDKWSSEIFTHNVKGTGHALQLARRLRATGFVYVSTAYVCGTQTGVIPEALHPLDASFNNAYERSKCAAEHLVARWSKRTGCPARILRPSIVVGPEKTYVPGGSDTGLYGFSREVLRLKRMLQAGRNALLMRGDPEAGVNFIPVDVLAHNMWQLAGARFADEIVHHLTSDRHPSVRTLLRVVGERCTGGAIDVAHDRGRKSSPVEQLMDRRATFYASYLRGPKTFARRAQTPIEVSDEALERFVATYVRERRSEGADALFERVIVRARDGHPLITYHVGACQSPTLLLCNAYGVSCDVWAPLAKQLAKDYRLLTWELRTHALSSNGQVRATGPDQHVQDLQSLMHHYGVERAFVAGFCTGADLAVHFAQLHPENTLGLVSISGALNSAGAEQTVFQRQMRLLAENAARDLSHARFYQQLLFGRRQADERDESMLHALAAALDPGDAHLASHPFQDAHALYAYAHDMLAHYAHCAATQLPQLDLRALFVVGDRDQVAHPDASRVACARWPRAQLLELRDAGHFALHSETALWDAIRSFVAAQDNAQGRKLSSAA